MSTTYRVPIYRLKLVKDRVVQFTEREIDEPHVAARLIARMIGNSDRENLVALFLDATGAITGAHFIAIGCLTSVQTTSREVFKAAIVANARSIVIGHNHPSGDVEPSRADIRFTRRLVVTGRTLGVPVLDHIIVGRAGFRSLMEMGIVSAPSVVDDDKSGLGEKSTAA